MMAVFSSRIFLLLALSIAVQVYGSPLSSRDDPAKQWTFSEVGTFTWLF